ncbi:MAG TPA: GntR family transcriptional regulator [Tepidisphaeraceae bacterium]|nr:GntR family transcriptional regulator [Tepidisphaeraceae bacterium]
MPDKTIQPVKPQPGRPLYLVVKEAILAAIEQGTFGEGEQMPSTQQLSQQLDVSLVTAHRALQELVASGVLQRSQGRGTFVDMKYKERFKSANLGRIGLVFHRESSIADYYHSQILEGVRQAGQAMNIDLVLLRFGEDFRGECKGFLFVNPLPEEIADYAAMASKKSVGLVVGAKTDAPNVLSLDVDNVDLAEQATLHLKQLGHKRIAYIGGNDQISNSRDRWAGFVQAMSRNNGMPADEHVLKSTSWRLSDDEKEQLEQLLTGKNRPTAVFAAGYYFALDVYNVAAQLGIKIPEKLSVIGVDDPPSASFLSPPLTTLRQPLVELGYQAVSVLVDRMQSEGANVPSRTLRGELVIRKSTGPAA